MTTIERMDRALVVMRSKGRRYPKAFYLGPDDWTDFEETEPKIINSVHNLKQVKEPSFKGVPVRASKNVAPRQSRLYDHTGQGHTI